MQIELEARIDAERKRLILKHGSWEVNVPFGPQAVVGSKSEGMNRLIEHIVEVHDRENEGFGSDVHIGPSIGQRDDCKHCGLEIEYHGPGADHRAQDNTKGWLDRGGNWRCNDDSHDHEPHAL